MSLGRSTVSLLLGSVLLVPLASCANSGVGQSLQDSLAADPNLTRTAPDAVVPSPSANAELPTDFPTTIPRYPNAELLEVVPASQDEANSEVSTVWRTTDDRDRVVAFYRDQLPAAGWKLAETSLVNDQGTLIAQRETPDATNITVAIAPTPASPTPAAAATDTQFTIRYTPSSVPTTQATPSPAETTSPSPDSQPQETFLGLEGSSEVTPTAGAQTPVAADLPANAYTDLDQAPKELRQPLTDLAQLGVLNLSASGKEKAAPMRFAPNKPVSRREYARWLFEANNRLFRDRAAQQLRPANNESQPAFRDVPRTDPDFAAIQGLAEAGIIPSPLSGALTVVNFRPDAQLSRETMLLWKVPMDTRQPLPTATLDAIQQTWGFQDAARIDPQAQRAVLADFQNADLSNIRRVFGYTTLFQPKRPVTRAEAAATLWYFGYQGDGVSAQEALKT